MKFNTRKGISVGNNVQVIMLEMLLNMIKYEIIGLLMFL
jgi:hypothetical protein